MAEMVLRPVQAGMCRLPECAQELSLTDLLYVNLAMDERDDSQRPGIQNIFQNGYRPPG